MNDRPIHEPPFITVAQAKQGIRDIAEMFENDPETAKYWADKLWRRILTAIASGDPVPARALAKIALLALEAQLSNPERRQHAIAMADQVTVADDPVILLTDDEQHAITLAGKLSTLITDKIIGHGPPRGEDISTIEDAIHIIQRAIAAQSWARAAPQRFRLLGEVLPEKDPS